MPVFPSAGHVAVLHPVVVAVAAARVGGPQVRPRRRLEENDQAQHEGDTREPLHLYVLDRSPRKLEKATP